jgi:hypothetical protein
MGKHRQQQLMRQAVCAAKVTGRHHAGTFPRRKPHHVKQALHHATGCFNHLFVALAGGNGLQPSVQIHDSVLAGKT